MIVPALAAGPRGERLARPAPPENAVIVEREDVSATVARIVVRPDGPLEPFAAGQYVTVGVRIGDRLVQRPYSSAADPRTAEAHELLVRLVPGGTLTPRLWELPLGARVRLGPPKGRFTLGDDDTRTHLLVASGTGLAPFVAVLRELVGRMCPPPIVLVHGVSHAEDLAWRGLLESLDRAGAIAYVPTVSRPDAGGGAGWVGRVGRAEVAVAAVSATLPVDHTVAYICGNPGTVTGVSDVLARRGFPDIRVERYWEAGGARVAGT